LLVNHIGIEDHKYAEFIASKGKVGKKGGEQKIIKTSKETIEPTKGTSKPTKAVAFDMASIKAEIESELKGGKIDKHEAEIKEQRAPALHAVENLKQKKGFVEKERVKTGVPGFDDLFAKGISQGCFVLVAGGLAWERLFFACKH